VNHDQIPGAARVFPGSLRDVIDRVTHAFSRNDGKAVCRTQREDLSRHDQRSGDLNSFPSGRRTRDDAQTDAAAFRRVSHALDPARRKNLVPRRRRAGASGRCWETPRKPPLRSREESVEHYEARSEGLEVTWLAARPVPGREIWLSRRN